jgi:hypothetical protein
MEANSGREMTGKTGSEEQPGAREAAYARVAAVVAMSAVVCASLAVDMARARAEVALWAATAAARAL